MNRVDIDYWLAQSADKHYEREEAVTPQSLSLQYCDERMDALSSDDILGGLQWADECHCDEFREVFKDDAKLARLIRGFIRNHVLIESCEQATKELAAHH